MNEERKLFMKEEKYKDSSGGINTQKLLEDAKNISNPDVQLTAIRAARQLLSCREDPPINDFLNIGILPIVVNCLERHDYESLQFEAAWILTNVTYGTTDDTLQVVKAGAVPFLLQNLSSPSKSVSFQALWALGNIIGDSAKFRDYVLEQGIVESLVILMESENAKQFFQRIGWVCVNLCRAHNQPPSFDAFDQIMTAIKILVKVNDDNVLVSVLWAIIYITDQGSSAIQFVINSKIVPTLLSFLHSSERSVINICLKVMRNLVSGTQSQTEYIMKLMCNKRIKSLLYSKSQRIRHNVLSFLSALFTNNDCSTLTILAKDNFWLGILFNLKNENQDIQIKAIDILKCMTTKGSKELFLKLIDDGKICSLWSLIEEGSNDITPDLVHCVNCIQKKFNEYNEEL